MNKYKRFNNLERTYKHNVLFLDYDSIKKRKRERETTVRQT